MKSLAIVAGFGAVAALEALRMWRGRRWKDLAVCGALWALALEANLAVALGWPQLSLNRLVAGIVTSVTGGEW